MVHSNTLQAMLELLCPADVQSLIYYLNNILKCQVCHNANRRMKHEA